MRHCNTCGNQVSPKIAFITVTVAMLVTFSVAVAVQAHLPELAYASQTASGQNMLARATDYGNASTTGCGSAAATRLNVSSLNPMCTFPQGKSTASRAKTYKIVYKPNKGKGSMRKQVASRGVKAKLRANAFKRSGYVFVGWNTKANGKGKQFKNRQAVKNLAKPGKTIVLYAQWAAAYTVVFKKNKGTGTMGSQVLVIGKKTALKKVTYTRKGYVFAGWNTKPNGKGTTYKNSHVVKNLAKRGKKITLYAQWRKAPGSSANSGSGANNGSSNNSNNNSANGSNNNNSSSGGNNDTDNSTSAASPDDAPSSTNEARYSYEIFRLDPAPMTSGCVYPVFIRTDNPSPSTIELLDGSKSALQTYSRSSTRQYYDDIEFTNPDDLGQPLHRVKGGYVGYLMLEPGTHTLQLREYDGGQYAIAQEIRVGVRSYDDDFNAWVDALLRKADVKNGTPVERMDAVVRWIIDCEGFRYPANINSRRVFLTRECGPCFKTKVWDSYLSPEKLCLIAKRIGGFEQVHNCYGDYEIGTARWQEMHSKCRATYRGTDYYYRVCPDVSTGAISGISYVNLSDTSALYPLG